jgi:hypothetical protein
VTHRIRLKATIVRSYAYYPFALLTKVITTSLNFGSDSAAAKDTVILVPRLHWLVVFYPRAMIATSKARSGRSGKRARIVCMRCHEKKIRCNLQRPGSMCTACTAEGAVCEHRPSGKGRRPAKAKNIDLELLSSTAGSSQRARLVQTEPVPTPLNAEINNIRALLGHQATLHNPDLTREHGVSNNAGTSLVRFNPRPASDDFATGVFHNYMTTYLDVCYTWIPIIDRLDDGNVPSSTAFPLPLQHALASAAGTIYSPLLPDINSQHEHYQRARQLIHSGRAFDTLSLLKAAMLLSICDNPMSDSATDGSFWWTGVAIRLAQDLRLHRNANGMANRENPGVLRRIWWTL